MNPQTNLLSDSFKKIIPQCRDLANAALQAPGRDCQQNSAPFVRLCYLGSAAKHAENIIEACGDLIGGKGSTLLPAIARISVETLVRAYYASESPAHAVHLMLCEFKEKRNKAINLKDFNQALNPDQRISGLDAQIAILTKILDSIDLQRGGLILDAKSGKPSEDINALKLFYHFRKHGCGIAHEDRTSPNQLDDRLYRSVYPMLS